MHLTPDSIHVHHVLCQAEVRNLGRVVECVSTFASLGESHMPTVRRGGPHKLYRIVKVGLTDVQKAQEAILQRACSVKSDNGTTVTAGVELLVSHGHDSDCDDESANSQFVHLL
jgi:hypothetical protein